MAAIVRCEREFVLAVVPGLMLVVLAAIDVALQAMAVPARSAARAQPPGSSAWIDLAAGGARDGQVRGSRPPASCRARRDGRTHVSRDGSPRSRPLSQPSTPPRASRATATAPESRAAARRDARAARSQRADGGAVRARRPARRGPNPVARLSDAAAAVGHAALCARPGRRGGVGQRQRRARMAPRRGAAVCAAPWLPSGTGERTAAIWQSTGTFDAAGVAPLRLVEREKGRDKRTVSFDRDRGVVRFSGASGAPAVARGAQDRWSWIAQLAAIAEAGTRHGERPQRWELQVAGLRGGTELWSLRGRSACCTPGDPPPELRPAKVTNCQRGTLARSGSPALLHVLRLSTERPYDLRIEAWLSPSLHHLPAGLRMSTPPSTWSLSLWRRSS